MRLLWFKLNDHLERVQLDYIKPGLFLDRERLATHRHYRDAPYEVYASGEHPSGCAAFLGARRTIAEALALAAGHHCSIHGEAAS